MESMKTNFSLPFNAYDFFGYILPGSLFSFGILYLLKDKIPFDEQQIEILTRMSAFSAILLLLGLLAILYFVGQVIGCVSHLLYDRLFVRNVIGYPFQYILDLKPRPDDSVRITYLLFVILGIQFLITPLLCEELYRFDFLKNNGGWTFCAIWMTSFGLLFLLSFIFRVILVISRMRRMDNREHFVKKSEENSIENDGHMVSLCKILTRVAWYIFYPVRKLTSTDTKVHQEIRRMFMDQMKRQTGLDLKSQTEYTSDAYWLAYISLVKHVPRHDAKINNWLNLYGCLRNYSCVFLILSFIMSVRQWICIYRGEFFLPDTINLIVAILLCLVLFVRYWIIYFSYYTKYIIRAYAFENKFVEAKDE